MRVIFNIKEKDGSVQVVPRIDYGARDTKWEMKAGENLYAAVCGMLRKAEGEAKSRNVPKPASRLSRIGAWLKAGMKNRS